MNALELQANKLYKEIKLGTLYRLINEELMLSVNDGQNWLEALKVLSFKQLKDLQLEEVKEKAQN